MVVLLRSAAGDSAGSATNWPLIRDAGAGGPTSRKSLEAVARRYWGAVYAAVRAAGATPEQAADLTQGFIADVMLGRSLLSVADKSRGRFRTFLRHAAINYVRDRMRRAKSTKRAPKDRSVIPAGEGLHRRPDPDAKAAERAFDGQWAAHAIRAAIERAAQRCSREGRELAWRVFQRRTLQPTLFGDAVPSYETLRQELELESAARAVHLSVLGRRVFAEELLAELADTIGPDEELGDEVRALMRSLESR